MSTSIFKYDARPYDASTDMSYTNVPFRADVVFSARTQVTRDGEAFGASQRRYFFKSEKEALHWAAERVARLEAKYVKKYSPSKQSSAAKAAANQAKLDEARKAQAEHEAHVAAKAERNGTARQPAERLLLKGHEVTDLSPEVRKYLAEQCGDCDYCTVAVENGVARISSRWLEGGEPRGGTLHQNGYIHSRRSIYMQDDATEARLRENSLLRRAYGALRQATDLIKQAREVRAHDAHHVSQHLIDADADAKQAIGKVCKHLSNRDDAPRELTLSEIKDLPESHRSAIRLAADAHGYRYVVIVSHLGYTRVDRSFVNLPTRENSAQHVDDVWSQNDANRRERRNVVTTTAENVIRALDAMPCDSDWWKARIEARYAIWAGSSPNPNCVRASDFGNPRPDNDWVRSWAETFLKTPKA